MRTPLLLAFVAAVARAAHGHSVEPPRAWKTCAACHAAEGSAAIGPSLHGVVGRRAGSLPGFGFSRAMKSANLTWDEVTLTSFLNEPQQVVPGNRMPFAGLTDPGEVAALVGYLKTLQ
jgi:cytochrome c